MDFDPAIIIVIIVIIGVGIYKSGIFSSEADVKRGIKYAPRKKISGINENELVRVSGNIVAAGRKLIAPLSGKEGVYYLIEITEEVVKADSTEIRTILREEKAGDIIINDGTGYALIETYKSEIFVLTDLEFSSGVFNEPKPEMKKFLQRHNISSTDWLGLNKALRIREAILEEGTFCSAAGFARHSKNEKRFGKLNAEKFVVISAADYGTVFISDDPSLAE